MKGDWDNRYQMRQEDDGTWTVFDTTATSGRENRMMVGLTEVRAQTYADRLNARQPYHGREKRDNGLA
ncbi:hypothetical protein ABID21_004600 [Pseudorhizobium tarimense]|uniref:Uncharacterized protein n=1 Tax=Pseudorhizobium tarimense TaxID=1079109 RepID=A0ABV2HD47_9HYPH